MKKVLAVVLILVMVLSFAGCGEGEKLQLFYDKVSECQALLDKVADSIYSNWYDAIYEDEFGEDIDVAIAYAFVENEEAINQIETLDAEISDVFKIVKESEQASLVKEVMSAYSDYYEFVINVSGSFKSYSADKETLKKELASLLKDLSYEL